MGAIVMQPARVHGWVLLQGVGWGVPPLAQLLGEAVFLAASPTLKGTWQDHAATMGLTTQRRVGVSLVISHTSSTSWMEPGL